MFENTRSCSQTQTWQRTWSYPVHVNHHFQECLKWITGVSYNLFGFCTPLIVCCYNTSPKK